MQSLRSLDEIAASGDLEPSGTKSSASGEARHLEGELKTFADAVD